MSLHNLLKKIAGQKADARGIVCADKKT